MDNLFYLFISLLLLDAIALNLPVSLVISHNKEQLGTIQFHLEINHVNNS